MKQIDMEMYNMLFPSEVIEDTEGEDSYNIRLPRQHLPLDSEIGLVSNRKKMIIYVHLLNGAPIELSIDSFTNVRRCVQ